MRRVVVGALLAMAVTVVPMTAVASPTGTAVNDETCRPSVAHPRPVVLIHGLGTDDSSWSFHAPQIARAGYCVFTLTYGEKNGTGGLGPIAASVEEITAFVDHVRAVTGSAKVDLVGHSEGGFLSLYVPKVGKLADRIGRVVALAPNTHGTTFSGMVTLARLIGRDDAPQRYTQAGGCEACGAIIMGSEEVAALNDGPIAQPGIAYTVVATRYDLVVTPPAESFVREPGVTNYFVQDKCALDPVGHISLAIDASVTSMILNGLDPTSKIRCSFVGLPF